MNVLVTAGPTREYIDPVRYISNDSSGLMGFELARAAEKRGHRVTLIAGPVALKTPKNVKRIDVVSAMQMKVEVLRHFAKADLIIMAAAVSDWRPVRMSKIKIKIARSQDRKIVTHGDLPISRSSDLAISRSSDLAILLRENPDILAELGRRKKAHQTLVGFALETSNLEKNARKKLIQKNCDWIVANRADAIASRSSSAKILGLNGRVISLPSISKSSLARTILKICAEH